MLILDTHALYWWVNRTPSKLGQRQIDAIETSESLAISAMVCWEMVWLVEHGRIALQLPVSDWLSQVEASGVAVISVSRAIATRAVLLPEHPRIRLIASLLPRLLNIKHNCSVLMSDSRIIRS